MHDRPGGDCTCKNGLERKNKIFSFEALFSRKSSLNTRQVHLNLAKYRLAMSLGIGRRLLYTEISQKHEIKFFLISAHFQENKV